jgi:hypothetical protein
MYGGAVSLQSQKK